VKARRVLPGLAAIGGLFALTGFWQHGGRFHASPGVVQAQTQAADTFQRVWAQAIPGFRAAALSADGGDIATVSADGIVRLWDWQRRPGRPLWRRAVPGASQAAVSAGGRTVLAYAPLDPTRTAVSFLGAGGQGITRIPLDGAIWDVCCSADGNYAAVSTGGHSLYLFTLGAHPALHHWRLGGIGNSLALSPDGSYVAAGTWGVLPEDGSGVACYTPRGATLWQYPGDTRARQALSNRLFEAQVARSGQCVLGVSYANVHEGDGTLYFWRGRGNGRPAWTHALGDEASYPQAMISEDGSYVAVTYTRLVTHGEQSVAERRLLVLDDAGNTLWEKGGLLFSPTLVSVAADGHRVTVSDGRSTLYHLNDEGRITAPYRFGATIRRTLASPDGRWLLVYTGDGLLNLIKLG